MLARVGSLRLPSGARFRYSDTLSCSLPAVDGELSLLVEDDDPRICGMVVRMPDRRVFTGYWRTRFLAIRLADVVDGSYDGPLRVPSPFAPGEGFEPQARIWDIVRGTRSEVTWLLATRRLVAGRADRPSSPRLVVGEHAAAWRPALERFARAAPPAVLGSTDGSAIEMDTTLPERTAVWGSRDGKRGFLGWSTGDQIARRLRKALDEPFPEFAVDGRWLRCDCRPVRLTSGPWLAACRNEPGEWAIHVIMRSTASARPILTLTADTATHSRWLGVLQTLRGDHA